MANAAVHPDFIRNFPMAVNIYLRPSFCCPGHIMFVVPPGSTWFCGLRWHETHIRYLTVLKGRIRLRYGERQVIVAEPKEVMIPRGVWYSWTRAESGGPRVVVTSRMLPMDSEQAVFYFSEKSLVSQGRTFLRPDGWPARLPRRIQLWLLNYWIILNSSHSVDHWPVLVGISAYAARWGFVAEEDSFVEQLLRTADWICTHLLLSMAALIVRLFGITPKRSDFVPAEVLDARLINGQP